MVVEKKTILNFGLIIIIIINLSRFIFSISAFAVNRCLKFVKKIDDY